MLNLVKVFLKKIAQSYGVYIITIQAIFKGSKKRKKGNFLTIPNCLNYKN